MRNDNARIRRVEPRDAILWILVCAALPVLLAVVETAFNRSVHSKDPFAQVVVNGLIASIVFIPLLCGCLQWYALRRFAPHLRLWTWLPAGAVSLAVAVGAIAWVGFLEATFQIAIMQWRRHDAIDAMTAVRLILGLAAVVGGIGLIALVKSLPQSLLLGAATGVPWRLFLYAAVAGAIAATLVEQLANLAGIHRPSALNGLRWSARFVELGLRASFGAIYGAATSYVLLRMLPGAGGGPASEHARHRRLGAVLLAAVVVGVCVPAMVTIVGRDGGRSSLAALRRAFTSEPAADESRGEAILRYSHVADAAPGRFPVARFSPDSRTFLVLDERRRLMLVDVATGRSLGQLAESLRLGERYDVAWSSDSSRLALRTRGTEEPVPGTRYTRYRPRIRTYSSPGGELLSEYEPAAGEECHESHAQVSLIFAPDASRLWTLCDQYGQPRAEDIMAIELDAASLQPLTVRRYGSEQVAGQPRTLGVSAGQVVYLQHRNYKVEEIRVGRLDAAAPVLRIEHLGGAGLADGLTLQWDVIEQDRIVADYCGVPASTANQGARGICRTIQLDAATGAVEKITDDVDRRFAGARWTLSMRDRLRVETVWRADDHHADIIVRDAPGGPARQSIRTYEQRPLSFSPDGRWLVTFAPNRRTLNVYRVAP